jgi:hypothetical protein
MNVKHALYFNPLKPYQPTKKLTKGGVLRKGKTSSFEISSSHGGEYDVQSCLLGCTAV